MKRKINFPELEKKPQICFVRKYRHKGKTHYMFYHAKIKKKVSGVLLSWLSNNIQRVNGKEFEEATISNFQNPEYVNLNEVDIWQLFKEKAFTLEQENEEILEKIKQGLVAFVVYIKQGSNIIGYARNITPSKVLTKKGLYSIFLDDSTFNDIRERKGIEVDEYADLVFKISDRESEGVILVKYNYNSIFDIITQQRKDSIKALRKSPLFNQHERKSEIEAIVNKNRMLQKMILNPIFKERVSEITFETFKTLKAELNSKVSFEIDETNQKVLFPNDKETEAIKDFIKTISSKFARDIDKKHILEVEPERIVK